MIDRRQRATELYPNIKEKPFPTHEFNKLSDQDLKKKLKWEYQYEESSTIDFKRRNEATENIKIINLILSWREKVRFNEKYNKNKRGYQKLEENKMKLILELNQKYIKKDKIV